MLFSESYGGSFTERLVDHLCYGYVPVDEDTDELTAANKRQYIATGTVGMLRKWVRENLPMNSRETAKMIYSLSRSISQS